MAFEHEIPVRELALRCPGAIAVFEAAGLDYYCEGHRSLSSVCSAAHADVTSVAAQLSAAATAAQGKLENDWHDGTLVAFLAHLDERFHRIHTAELADLTSNFGSVAANGGDDSFQALGPILRALQDVSEAHQMTVSTLFADAMALEAGVTLVEMELPPLVRVVHDLACEHVRFRSLLQAARSLTNSHAPSGSAPHDGRATFCARLFAWEREAHRHAHLENNVLVPWTSELDPMANRDVMPLATAGESPILVTP
jgi:regulator of cell morphogenesis and NO signaling